MSKSFTKLFSSITESTVWCESHETVRVWITMLAMADQAGRVWASIPGLANRARVEIAQCETALLAFLSPDAYSRTKEHEGRRIAEMDGGWVLLNHAKYRALQDIAEKREADAARQRKHYYAKKGDGSTGNAHALSQEPVRPNDSHGRSHNLAEADTDTDTEKKRRVGATRPPECPQEEIVAAYHDLLPDSPKVRQWTEKRRGRLRARWAEDAERQSVGWWRQFFGYVAGCPFLVGKVDGREGRDPFQADLEWLVTEGNFVKVIEGKYEPKGVRL